MCKCVMGDYYLILFIVESGFKGPFLTQVSLFHQPHPLLSHVHNLGIASNTNAQMISSWICSMNYLHWNLVVHVCAPRKFFDLKMIFFFFPGASACVRGTSAKTGLERCWRRLRLIQAARERTGWMTPTLNGERDTALLLASAALLYITADGRTDTKPRPIQMSE